MPRRPRHAPGGHIYHVLNRAAGRRALFRKPADYDAFERILIETCARMPGVDLLAYCLMPNHWHLLLRPSRDGEVSEFMRLLTVTHTQRLHAHRHTAGTGPVYQGRFKSFPVQSANHFLTVVRYVERNALRAGLVERAQDWRWCSLHARGEGRAPLCAVLRDWPAPGIPARWVQTVNRPMTRKEREAVRLCVKRSRPYGDTDWVERTAAKLGLTASLRPPGRPRKQDPEK